MTTQLSIQVSMFFLTFLTAVILCITGLGIPEGSWWSKWVCGTACVSVISLLIQGLVLVCG